MVPLEQELMLMDAVATLRAFANAGTGRVEIELNRTVDAAILADIEAAVRSIEPGLPPNSRLQVELTQDGGAECL